MSTESESCMNTLTDRTIRALQPVSGKQITVSDKGTSGVRGLSIVVSYGGAKIFYFRYLAPTQKQKRFRIGEFPATSLANARQKAREFRQLIDSGDDPDVLNNKAILGKREVHTIGRLWKDYHQDALTRKKSAIFENQMWNKHLESFFGPLDIRHFTRDTLLDFLSPFRNKHSPAVGARVQAILSQLGNYAVERRVVQFSPAYQLGKKKTLPTRDRFLNRNELETVWRCLQDKDVLQQANVSRPLAICLQLILLTCVRRAEIAGISWEEIDLVDGLWTLNGSRTKNGRAHVIPISNPAHMLLDEAKQISRRPHSLFVFPGRRSEEASKGLGHIRPDAVSRACTRFHKVLEQTYDVKKFTPHDLRRTGATFMASTLKADRFTISQILNHASDHGGGASVTAVYARYDYLEEKTGTLVAWGELLANIIGDEYDKNQDGNKKNKDSSKKCR